jgi:hypothetical protein
MAALQLASTTTYSSSAAPPPSSVGDAVIVNMLHGQACGLQNILSLASTILDPSFIGHAHWRDQVLLTLKCYKLTDHILSDASPVNDPTGITWRPSPCPRSSARSWVSFRTSPRSTTSPHAKSGARSSTRSSAIVKCTCFTSTPRSATSFRVTSH